MKVKQQQSSNITIAPNIYVRTSSNLQSDEEFVKKVYGHKALNILKSRFPKSYTSRFTRAQIEEMKQNVICRHGKIREHAYGKASWGENVVWSCRCENITCHAYEKCMSLPNAMRIDRKNDAENFSDTNGISIVENETGEDIEYGFNPDDCVFAPPHVAVVLPILEKIISEGEDESIDTNFVIPDFYEDESAQENNNNPNKNETVAEFTAEKFKFDGDFADKRVLVICENMQEAGYYSTILYKHKVKHRFFKSEGCTLNRRIADVFWDYCGDEIEKETFFMRCAIRTDGDESETLDFYDALFDLCGDSNIGDEGGLHVSALADALNNNNRSSNSPNPGEPLLNLDDADYPVTVSTLAALSSHLEDEYDEVMVLLGETTEDFAPARFNLFSAVQEVFGSPPLVIHKESAAGWVFATSGLGRPCRIGLDNYTGEPARHCLNIELGLWGDVDGKSFLTEQTGDAIRLQLYIAEKLKEGDELTVEKSPDGGYWFFHEKNMLGAFPEAIMREIQSIEGFPEDFSGFEGIYIKNIVTCIAEKNDSSIPSRFRESRFWLGLDITGYAKVLI